MSIHNITVATPEVIPAVTSNDNPVPQLKIPARLKLTIPPRNPKDVGTPPPPSSSMPAPFSIQLAASVQSASLESRVVTSPNGQVSEQ